MDSSLDMNAFFFSSSSAVLFSEDQCSNRCVWFVDPGNWHNALASSCCDGVKSEREDSSPGGRGGHDLEAEKGDVMIEVMELKTLRSGPLDCLDGVVVALVAAATAAAAASDDLSSASRVVVVDVVVPLALFTSTSLSFASTTTSGALVSLAALEDEVRAVVGSS